MSQVPVKISPRTAFAKSAATDKSIKYKAETKPFSIRLTQQERALLESYANNQTLAAYIRQQLLGGDVKKRRVLRKPKADSQKIVLVLSALGESNLASNLNQLAKHANMGSLDVTEQTAQQLEEAYQAVILMRDTLISALR